MGADRHVFDGAEHPGGVIPQEGGSGRRTHRPGVQGRVEHRESVSPLDPAGVHPTPQASNGVGPVSIGEDADGHPRRGVGRAPRVAEQSRVLYVRVEGSVDRSVVDRDPPLEPGQFLAVAEFPPDHRRVQQVGGGDARATQPLPGRKSFQEGSRRRREDVREVVRVVNGELCAPLVGYSGDPVAAV